jgi:hypothetical protein
MVIRRFIYSRNKLGCVACSTVTGMAADAGGVKQILSIVSNRSAFNTCDTLLPFHHLHFPDTPKLKKPTELNRC